MKLNLLTSAIFLAGGFFSSLSSGQDNSTKDNPGKYLDIVEGDRVIARFMYAHDLSSKESRHDTYKPYLHVMAKDGKTPITKGPGGKFTHHRGIFLGWNKIGFKGKSIDLWHMKTSEIIHQKFLDQKSDSQATTVVAKLNWMAPSGEVILEETRTMEFDHSDSKDLFSGDFTCRLVAVSDDVQLNGDPEHAGFQYRPNNEVAENKSAKYLFHDDGVNPKKDRDLPWVALTYKSGGNTYSVQHMNHPENPKDSIYSAYRDYGRFGSFPKFKLKKGESITLRYKIRVTEGEMLDRSEYDKHYKSYVAAK